MSKFEFDDFEVVSELDADIENMLSGLVDEGYLCDSFEEVDLVL